VSTRDEIRPLYRAMLTLGVVAVVILAGGLVEFLAFEPLGQATGAKATVHGVFRYDPATGQTSGPDSRRFTPDQAFAAVVDWTSVPTGLTVAARWYNSLGTTVGTVGPAPASQLVDHATIPVAVPEGFHHNVPGEYAFVIERFNAVERVSHWTMAICFVFLALTGAFMLWGKYLVLPWLGYKGFAYTTIAFQNIHNFVGPLFIFSLVVSFLIFVRDNIIHALDIKWLTHLGGMFGGHEIPSGRFNGGEKLWFWGVLVFLGLLVSVSGLILDFPNWNQGRELMQQANVVHAVCAVLFISASFAHIYIGTIGMEGAYRAMRDGYVDEEWAREHHALWYEEVKQGRRPEKIVGAPQPATGD